MTLEKNKNVPRAAKFLGASKFLRTASSSKIRTDQTLKNELNDSTQKTSDGAGTVKVACTYRLAKYLSGRNLCSRREAERHILNGDVTVNGVKILTPVFFVSESDSISFCGKRVENKPPARLWIYNKLVGEITTHNDPQKRMTVFDAVAARHGLLRVLSVGRLDINSEGLILLTNCNSIAHELETTHLERVYNVRVFGQTDALLGSKYAHVFPFRSDNVTSIELRNIIIDGIKYAPIFIQIAGHFSNKSRIQNFWIRVSLHEGKNREIRKVLGRLGLKVSRLIRVKFGPFELGDLPAGELLETPVALYSDQAK
ncbi:MAG: pseudouridine synthase [Holosporales bacterium]|jgi:23S rRNA pseudouridine2605 synthase|nr:pseudouridine synthase [Holosporales bacterium]